MHGVDRQTIQELPALWMPPNQGHFASWQSRRLNAEQPKFPVSHDCHSIRRAQVYLLKDFKRCRNRFGKDGNRIWHTIRHAMQAGDRQAEQFRHRAVAPINAERCAIGAVTFITASADGARTACGVDLANHALADPGGVFARNHDTNKLVPQNATKIHVAARNLDIGVADTDKRGTYERLASTQDWSRIVVDLTQFAIVHNGVHWRLALCHECGIRLFGQEYPMPHRCHAAVLYYTGHEPRNTGDRGVRGCIRISDR
jgi:hypothetical protein